VQAALVAASTLRDTSSGLAVVTRRRTPACTATAGSGLERNRPSAITPVLDEPEEPGQQRAPEP